ncbi:hypothetical protein J7643_03050 [bacterium]|nr:hypothetical protein [bacterium]
MAFDSEPASNEATSPWAGVRNAFKNGGVPQDTPEIAAIFEQIKNLREAERSLRSIRRTMDLDNVPSLDVIVEEEPEVTSAPPTNDLTKLLDSYLALRDEKDALEAKLNQVVGVLTNLQATVEGQSKLIDELKQR